MQEVTPRAGGDMMQTPRSFMVEVSAELLAQLGEWSEPVEVRVEADPAEAGGYRMTFRRCSAQPSTSSGEPT